MWNQFRTNDEGSIVKMPFDFSVGPFGVCHWAGWNTTTKKANLEGWHNVGTEEKPLMRKHMDLPDWVVQSFDMALAEYEEALFEGATFTVKVSDVSRYEVKGLDLNPESIAWRKQLRAAKIAKSLANKARVNAKMAETATPAAPTTTVLTPEQAKEKARQERLAKHMG